MSVLYSSLEAMVRHFGLPEMLALAEGAPDAEGNPTVDGQRVTNALSRASREADTYLAPRYAVPLHVNGDDTPEPLRGFVADMARYHLTGGDAQESESIIRRYEEARNWLKDVARGVTDLLLPDGAGSVAEAADSGVFFEQGKRPWDL